MHDRGYRGEGPEWGSRPPPGYGWEHGYGWAPTRRLEPEELDELIRREVRVNLWEDTWLNASNIEVSVADRVVTLNGVVKDFISSRYAWDDAWETIGVRGVISRLKILGHDILPEEQAGSDLSEEEAETGEASS